MCGHDDETGTALTHEKYHVKVQRLENAHRTSGVGNLEDDVARTIEKTNVLYYFRHAGVLDVTAPTIHARSVHPRQPNKNILGRTDGRADWRARGRTDGLADGRTDISHGTTGGVRERLNGVALGVAMCGQTNGRADGRVRANHHYCWCI